jgi:hypothetical protein
VEELLLIATPTHAPSWRDAIASAPRLALVDELVSPLSRDLRRAGSALERHPEASVVVAVPGDSLDALMPVLRARSGAVLVQPPPGPWPAISLRSAAPGGGRIVFAHEWTSLAGPQRLRQAWLRSSPGVARVRVQGEPFASSGDLGLVLSHALALVQIVCGELSLSSVAADRRALSIELGAGAARVELSIAAGEPRASVDFESGPNPVTWEVVQDRERMRRGRGAEARESTASAALPQIRALRRLLDPARPGAGSSDETTRLSELACEVVRRLPGRFPEPEATFALSRAARRVVDERSVLPFGLEGDLPTGPSTPELAIPSGAVPGEVWAFRAGLKPVVFLTVAPQAVGDVLAQFPDCHVERRERRVEVLGQDVWVDRRTSGEARTELYVSRDPELAREASRLQAEGDPSGALPRLGELMGYPPCCVQAFGEQDDRSNNSRNRYQTMARTGAGGWHWELNNLSWMLVPFFPCSYRCDAARAYARATLRAWEEEAPPEVERFRTLAQRPALYFEHDAVLHFDGRAQGQTIDYRAVCSASGAGPALRRLAAAAAGGDRLHFAQDRLSVSSAGRPLFELRRAEPLLGFVAPFGPT